MHSDIPIHVHVCFIGEDLDQSANMRNPDLSMFVRVCMHVCMCVISHELFKLCLCEGRSQSLLVAEVKRYTESKYERTALVYWSLNLLGVSVRKQ